MMKDPKSHTEQEQGSGTTSSDEKKNTEGKSDASAQQKQAMLAVT